MTPIFSFSVSSFKCIFFAPPGCESHGQYKASGSSWFEGCDGRACLNGVKTANNVTHPGCELERKMSWIYCVHWLKIDWIFANKPKKIKFFRLFTIYTEWSYHSLPPWNDLPSLCFLILTILIFLWIKFNQRKLSKYYLKMKTLYKNSLQISIIRQQKCKKNLSTNLVSRRMINNMVILLIIIENNHLYHKFWVRLYKNFVCNFAIINFLRFNHCIGQSSWKCTILLWFLEFNPFLNDFKDKIWLF